MDGFTGLDIAKAKSDILEYYNSCVWTAGHMNHAIENFATTLSNKWASPVAVEFSKDYNDKIETLFTDFNTTFLHICSGATDAGKALANANGMDFDNYMTIGGLPDPGEVKQYSVSKFNCKEEINGAVGMDTESVRIALEIFIKAIHDALNELDEIPDSIGFYDPNGQLIEAYSRNIKEFKNKFRELFNTMIQDVNGYIETETDNILLAKEQATQAMNG